MRYLISGGAGFIGSHLSEALLSEGHAVEALDDLSTGSIDNVRHLLDHPRFRLTVDTVMNEPTVARLMADVDVTYHLAATVGVQRVMESALRTIETNLQPTHIILRIARRRRTPVLFASTSEVYGKSAQVPFREDGDMVIGATSKHRWSYACSKALDEFVSLGYWHEHGVPTVVVRLFNTVGPRQSTEYGMVLPTFVRQALAGQSIRVFGDGTQSRCFTHVDDVVRALVALMRTPAAHGQVYNVGQSGEVSMLALAKRVRNAVGARARIVLVPYDQAYPPGFEDMRRRVPDTSKLRALVGWTPERDLDRIIADVVAYWRERALADRAETLPKRRAVGRIDRRGFSQVVVSGLRAATPTDRPRRAGGVRRTAT